MLKRCQTHFTRLVLGSMFVLSGAIQAADYQLIEWTDLIPADDLEALMNPPDFLMDIVDGSEQDSVEALNAEDEVTKRFQQALTSARVIEDFDKKPVRIPGFIVPLEYTEDQQATAFFVVPYFGACLHTPPPPPNQIIYATDPEGIPVDNIFDPYWFEGTLIVEHNSNELGTSAYSLRLDNMSLYQE